MNNSIDDVLRRALSPEEEADGKLNQTILNHLKEDTLMKPYHKKRISIAVLVTILILCFSSITVYAAWKYLTPDKLAEEVNNTKLADAFLSDGATVINETQTYGDYRVTLLSIVSGMNISNYSHVSKGIAQPDRTYITVAIERIDGTPIPDTSEDAYGSLEFCVSPLVGGYDPMDVNVFALHGAYSDIVEDGILYRLLDCNNVMIFADHNTYLSVSDTFLPGPECYHFDETTGIISRNENYQGLNALFSLPLDDSFADAEAVAKLLDEILPTDNETAAENDAVQDEQSSQESPIPPDDPSYPYYVIEEKIRNWVRQLTPENMHLYTDRVEHTVQVLYPDENGNFTRDAYRVEGRGGSDAWTAPASVFFSEEPVGVIKISSYAHSCTLSTLRIDTMTANEDGSNTFAVYIPKEGLEIVTQEELDIAHATIFMNYYDVSFFSFHDWSKGINRYNIDTYADRVEASVQKIFPDETGILHCKPYSIDGYEDLQYTGSCPASFYSSMNVGDVKVFHTNAPAVEGDDAPPYFSTYTRNADGSFTFACYIPKKSPE